MKSSILTSLVMLGLSAAFVPVRVMAQEPIHVTIPFNFNAGSKPLAAGEYRVRQLSPVALAIQSVDGNSQIVLMAQAGEPSGSANLAKVTFNRYGDHYFLTQVSEPGKGWVVAKSAAEKELLARKQAPTPLSIVASK
jgi:hypothetical protein